MFRELILSVVLHLKGPFFSLSPSLGVERLLTRGGIRECWMWGIFSPLSLPNNQADPNQKGGGDCRNRTGHQIEISWVGDKIGAPFMRMENGAQNAAHWA